MNENPPMYKSSTCFTDVVLTWSATCFNFKKYLHGFVNYILEVKNIFITFKSTMGTGSFPGVKRPGRGADHPPPSKCRGHERVELYLYSLSGPLWPVIGRTFTFSFRTLTFKSKHPSCLFVTTKQT